jgi:hypothetical protein
MSLFPLEDGDCCKKSSQCQSDGHHTPWLFLGAGRLSRSGSIMEVNPSHRRRTFPHETTVVTSTTVQVPVLPLAALFIP